MEEIYEDEIIDVELGPIGPTGFPTITDRPVQNVKSRSYTAQERQQTIDWLLGLHPITRLRLLNRYWTWDQKGYRKALLGCTSMSRVVLHRKMNPALPNSE